MKNLYRPLCLMALLAVAPTVLIGCSGGGSSNNSSSNSNTRATATYSTLDNANFLEPLDVSGVLKPQKFVSGIPDYSKGNGIFTYILNPQEDVEGGKQLTNAAVINSSSETRVLYITRRSATGSDGPVGTVYEYNNSLEVTLSRSFHSDLPPYGAEYVLTGGTATVTAINGNDVTLELENIQLHAITDDTPEPKDIKLSGSITYNRKNIKTLKVKINNGDAIKQSLKN